MTSDVQGKAQPAPPPPNPPPASVALQRQARGVPPPPLPRVQFDPVQARLDGRVAAPGTGAALTSAVLRHG